MPRLKKNAGVCVICDKPFKAVRKEARTCSYSCARLMAWQNPAMRERQRVSLIAALARPEVRSKVTARSRAYWADPANHEMASEIQRQTWKDTMIRGRRLVGIDRAWASDEAKKRVGDQKRNAWKDPEYRAMVVAKMRTGKRGRVKRRVIELAAANPSMTPAEMAQRLRAKVDAVQRILRDARRDGLLGVRPGDGPRLRKRAGIEVAK